MACTIAPVPPLNDPCAFQAFVVGKQIVGLLYQEAAGAAPAIMTTLAGLQAGLAATGDDKLYILKNLAASTTPAPSDQTLSNNDVPYGGEITTDRVRKVEAQMQYLSAADIATTNTLRTSQSPKRVWLLDDKNVLQGPFENAYLGVGEYVRGVIGAATPNRISITMTHHGLDVPAIGLPIAGIAALVNVA